MRALFLIMISLAFIQCKKQVPPFGVEYVSVEKASELIEQNKKMKVIDVRTEEEATEGKLEGAIVIDVRKDDFQDQIDKLKKDDVYLVYCRSGSRSATAVEIMAEKGFDRLYMMEGGYLEWADKMK